jgi:hypothetical protein
VAFDLESLCAQLVDFLAQVFLGDTRPDEISLNLSKELVCFGFCIAQMSDSLLIVRQGHLDNDNKTPRLERRESW